MPRILSVMLTITGLSISFHSELAAQSTGPKVEELAKSRQRAVNFLKTTQAEDGSWTSADSPGICGLVTYSLLISQVPTTDPAAQKALKHLATYVQPDGGIYLAKSNHKNYETSICLLAFEAANQDGKFAKTIQNAAQLVRNLQFGGADATPADDVKFGGAGYGRNGDRPDLSNTTFLVDALKAAGATKDDPAIQKALVFVSRCQNLESGFNVTPFAAKLNDGGFYYTPAAGGNSFAGKTPDGGLRSYGSMTYAGLKSMVFAGLTPEDPRVKAATEWITKFYTVQENPGMGQQGVYYYYMMFAKALNAMDLDFVTDAQGQRHDWRKELSEQLLHQQRDNGSWINSTDRWQEGNPDLTTAYVLIALKHCEAKVAKPAK